MRACCAKIYVAKTPPIGVARKFGEGGASGDPEEHGTPTFSPTTRWQHQKSHQFHLLLHPTDGSTSTSTPSSPKFNGRKQIGGNNLRICTQHTYRFLDIQITSNRLRDAPVVHRGPSYSVTFISQYPPPDTANSFRLVVSMLDLKPKGSRF
ncbi:hypothetical protein AVEN_140958-1 [Araneus ventricosus]|uniref:Uncharacterized protein n=1 Tax=Araneus ventricosus TaxID=182803 RepID=A0A4Y2GE33_ARAVE|nr:hypothetical protein AVEN_140958-1 [Araneus ventricosus]